MRRAGYEPLSPSTADRVPDYRHPPTARCGIGRPSYEEDCDTRQTRTTAGVRPPKPHVGCFLRSSPVRVRCPNGPAQKHGTPLPGAPRCGGPVGRSPFSGTPRPTPTSTRRPRSGLRSSVPLASWKSGAHSLGTISSWPTMATTSRIWCRCASERRTRGATTSGWRRSRSFSATRWWSAPAGSSTVTRICRPPLSSSDCRRWPRISISHRWLNGPRFGLLIDSASISPDRDCRGAATSPDAASALLVRRGALVTTRPFESVSVLVLSDAGLTMPFPDLPRHPTQDPRVVRPPGARGVHLVGSCRPPRVAWSDFSTVWPGRRCSGRHTRAVPG